MCDEAIDDYSPTIQFVPECYKSQEMCNKAINIFFFLFDYIPDWYETQKMCDEAAVNSLAALKLVPDWFITSQIPIWILIQSFPILYSLMMMYWFLMNILVK